MSVDEYRYFYKDDCIQADLSIAENRTAWRAYLLAYLSAPRHGEFVLNNEEMLMMFEMAGTFAHHALAFELSQVTPPGSPVYKSNAGKGDG